MLRSYGPWIFASSFLIAFSQLVTVTAVFVGLSAKTCPTNDLCTQRGTFCSPLDRCIFCGSNGPLGLEVGPDGKEYNWALAERYAGFNSTAVAVVCANPTQRVGIDGYGNDLQFSAPKVTAWCDACFVPETDVVSDAPAAVAISMLCSDKIAAAHAC